MPLAGRPMVEWSLAALRACEAVRSILVAAPPGRVGEMGERLGGAPAATGDAEPAGVEVVAGGATRAESVANALEAVETELVAIHDAARPLLTAELVGALLAELGASPGAAGVIAAAPVTDTVKQVRQAERRSVERTLDRSTLWAAQTPQVFRTEALREALAAAAEPDAATDEAMLVEAAGGMVLIHAAGPENLKITTPLDLRVAQLLLEDRSR